MKKALSIFAFLALLGYLLFVMLSAPHDQQQERLCQQLIVEIVDSTSQYFIDKKEVVNILDKNKLNPIKRPFSQINTEIMEETLRKNPWINIATVYKTPADNIKVIITQKKPILRVFSNNKSYYVDAEGTIMPTSTRQSGYLPLASGEIENSFATTELYKFALFLHKHPFWNSQIAQIYVHKNKEVELIPRVGNFQIIMGDFSDFKEKLNNLQLFYEQAIPKIGWDKYRKINLTYKNQIVCTIKETS